MRSHRLAVVTAVATYVLLLVGGLVHGTGSGLACPDWPTCYGSLLPHMEGGVAIEHSHRLFASAVGLLTIALAISLGRARWKVGALAVGLVVFQGVLGGLTVLYQLPDLVSTAHLATSMLFFALLLYLAWSTQPKASAVFVPIPTKRLTKTLTLLIYAQIVLGALVRHTESGLACSGWLLCHGSLWPTGIHPATQLHMAHRWMGVTIAVLVFAYARAIRRLRPRTAIALRALVLAQVALGLLSVKTGLGLWAVQAHLAGAAALFACCVWLWLDSPAESASKRAPMLAAEARA